MTVVVQRWWCVALLPAFNHTLFLKTTIIIVITLRFLLLLLSSSSFLPIYTHSSFNSVSGQKNQQSRASSQQTEAKCVFAKMRNKRK